MSEGTNRIDGNVAFTKGRSMGGLVNKLTSRIHAAFGIGEIRRESAVFDLLSRAPNTVSQLILLNQNNEKTHREPTFRDLDTR
jgi:hypothetical protein